MNLPAKKRCPLHGRTDCCGRSEAPRYKQVKKQSRGIWKRIGGGRWKAADGREKWSPAALRKHKEFLVKTRRDPCAACGEPFTDYRDIELSHVHGKGIGGAFRDDSKTVLMHARANREQGSMDLETYLKTKWKPEHCL